MQDASASEMCRKTFGFGWVRHDVGAKATNSIFLEAERMVRISLPV